MPLSVKEFVTPYISTFLKCIVCLKYQIFEDKLSCCEEEEEEEEEEEGKGNEEKPQILARNSLEPCINIQNIFREICSLKCLRELWLI